MTEPEGCMNTDGWGAHRAERQWLLDVGRGAPQKITDREGGMHAQGVCAQGRDSCCTYAPHVLAKGVLVYCGESESQCHTPLLWCSALRACMHPSMCKCDTPGRTLVTLTRDSCSAVPFALVTDRDVLRDTPAKNAKDTSRLNAASAAALSTPPGPLKSAS